MKHVFWVYRDQLAGRPGPSEAPWSLSELSRGGFDVMLSLASDLFSHSDAAGAGMSRTCIPFPDVVPPDAYAVASARASLSLTFEFLEAHVDQGRSVLVHCAGGKDRTGLVLAHYIARRERVDAATAIRRLRVVRPEALSAAGWEGMALELIEAEAELCREDP